MRTEIEQRFETESKLLPELRERFTAEVERWVFSTAEILSDYEGIMTCRGSDMEAYSDVLSGADDARYACGFDESDRLILIQHFASETAFGKPGSEEPALQIIPSKETLVEEFISYRGAALVDVARFVRGDLQAMRRLTFTDRLLVEEECFRDGCFLHTRFKYEGRRMVLQQSISEKGHAFYEIAFGPHDDQTYFRVRRDGTRFQLFQPLPKGMTLKSVKETTRDRLLAVVPQVVAAAKVAEPIYCLALAYDGEGSDALPPLLGIGLESERQRWQAERGNKAWQWVWNPAEFLHYEKPHTQLEDEALEEACDRMNSKLAECASMSPAIKLLVEVATELNRAVWPAEIQRTADFVAYAVDFELGSLRKNLKACVSSERLAELKAKKLL